MSSHEIVFRLATGTRNMIVGKALLIVLVSAAAAIAMKSSDAYYMERAQTLTVEEYTSEFETYKADLVKDIRSPGLTVLWAFLIVIALVVSYEVGGRGLGWMIGLLVDRFRAWRPETAPASDPARTEHAK